jgi:prohibitin 2
MTTTLDPLEPDVDPIPAPEPPRGWWRRLKAWAKARATSLIIWSLVLLAIAVYLAPDVFITIGAGEAGVLWKRFDGGTETVARDDRPFFGRLQADRTGTPTVLTENLHRKTTDVSHVYPYSEGMEIIWPWDRMAIYNIRLQQVSRTYDVLTSDGLDVKAEITFRWKPIEEDLGRLHRDVGPNYVDTLIAPLIGAYAREEIARHESNALYSPARLQIQEAIRTKTKQALMSRYYPEQNRESYVIVEDVLLRSVVLPKEVRAAVEEKVVQKHLAESYRYRLERETQEADRKAIEAAGIQRFQTAVGGTVSEGYLRLREIEATMELSKSPNTKVIVVGGGKDGVPVILSGADAGTPPSRPNR